MIISFMVIVIFIHEHRTNMFNKGYLFAEGEVIIGEYSPRRIGDEYSPQSLSLRRIIFLA